MKIGNKKTAAEMFAAVRGCYSMVKFWLATYMLLK